MPDSTEVTVMMISCIALLLEPNLLERKAPYHSPYIVSTYSHHRGRVHVKASRALHLGTVCPACWD